MNLTVYNGLYVVELHALFDPFRTVIIVACLPWEADYWTAPG